LERLQSGKWISMIEDYEHGRMSRKWKVLVPTGGNSHPVKNSPCENLTPRGSIPHPVTGVNSHPYKESSKKNLKETLSLKNQALQNYFSQTMPPRKRESELKALQELLETYTADQVGLCVEHVSLRGVPGSGEPCHSPMVFLSKAIARVLSEAMAEREKRERLEAQKRAEAERLAIAAREELETNLAFAEQEAAFVKAFPSEAEQAEKVAEFAAKFPWLAKEGVIARRLAISQWQIKQL
jgi:hypothetical protein